MKIIDLIVLLVQNAKTKELSQGAQVAQEAFAAGNPGQLYPTCLQLTSQPPETPDEFLAGSAARSDT